MQCVTSVCDIVPFYENCNTPVCPYMLLIFSNLGKYRHWLERADVTLLHCYITIYPSTLVRSRVMLSDGLWPRDTAGCRGSEAITYLGISYLIELINYAQSRLRVFVLVCKYAEEYAPRGFLSAFIQLVLVLLLLLPVCVRVVMADFRVYSVGLASFTLTNEKLRMCVNR